MKFDKKTSNFFFKKKSDHGHNFLFFTDGFLRFFFKFLNMIHGILWTMILDILLTIKIGLLYLFLQIPEMLKGTTLKPSYFFKNVDVFLKVFLTNFFFFLSVGGNFLRVTLVFSVVFELPVVSTPFNSGRVVPLGVEQAQNLKERLFRLI